MSTPSGVPQAPVSAGGVEGQAAVIGEVAKEMYSLRFDGSSYLSRTPTTVGNRKTWTFSCWIKRSRFTVASQNILMARTGGGSDYSYIDFRYNNIVRIAGSNGPYTKYTNQVFRDTSAWSNLICSIDSTNTVASERIRLFINGVKVDGFSNVSDIAIDAVTAVNSTVDHQISYNNGGDFFNGYLANIHFIDGEALPPEATGELISDVWRPASYSGDYGVNGFHLDFDPDNMVYDVNGQLTTVMDASGNDNHWTAH